LYGVLKNTRSPRGMNRQNSHFLAHLLLLQRSLVVKLGVSPSRSRSLTRSHSLSSGDSTKSHKGCSAETKSRPIITNNLQSTSLSTTNTTRN
jgi:hypothetical protein